jgi:hypothetical protein
MALTKKQKKAAYDRDYRKKNRARIKANHAAYFQRTYDPIAAAKERKKRMPYHVEYCRQPKYVAYKREYDRKRRASKFGEFAAAYEALKALNGEIRRLMPDRFERYAQSGRHQWNPINQRRYRRKQNGQSGTYGNFLEGIALGNT